MRRSVRTPPLPPSLLGAGLSDSLAIYESIKRRRALTYSQVIGSYLSLYTAEASPRTVHQTTIRVESPRIQTANPKTLVV